MLSAVPKGTKGGRRKASGFGIREKLKSTSKKSVQEQLQDYIKQRDYTGAIALLEFNRQSNDDDDSTLPWLGYCSFHLGDYKKALEAYHVMMKSGNAPSETHLYIACCMYYLQLYKHAEEEASKGPKCALQVAWRRKDGKEYRFACFFQSPHLWYNGTVKSYRRTESAFMPPTSKTTRRN